METCLPRYSPLQMSVNPPVATAISPRFSSPAESTIEAGSRSVVLATAPKAVVNFAFCESVVDGYAFAKIVEGFQRRMGWPSSDSGHT